jgi:hypothetical protein
MAGRAAKRGGRPKTWTDAKARVAFGEICRLMAEEGASLRQVCRRDDMPPTSRVMEWLRDEQRFPEFREQYALARESQPEYWADEILDIADDASNDWMERETRDGRIEAHVNYEHIQRSKLRVDTRKWLMSKLAPKKYGDRTQPPVETPESAPLEHVTINAPKGYRTEQGGNGNGAKPN